MRTVGQILKEEREKKFYTLEEIEKNLKIRKELLEALEADDYSKLPPQTFVQGFIKNYGKFLGLEPEKLLAVFRRENSSKKIPTMIETAFKPLDKSRFNLTPSRVLSLVVISIIVIFFSYLWVEYRFLSAAPFLELTEPTDQISIQADAIKVIGKTDPETKVSINNQEVTVDLSGSFSQEIKLTNSINTVVVTATSKYGKIAKIERTVFLKQ